MQITVTPLFDAEAGRWYGVVIGQVGSGPAKILGQTEPQYGSKEECVAALKEMIKATLEGLEG